MSDELKFLSDDPIGEIEDPIARYLARTIVHVRKFFPFYVGGVAFALAMLVLPVVRDDGRTGDSATLAGSGGVAGAVARSGSTAAAASGARTATGAGAAAAAILGGDPSGYVSFVSDEGGADLGGEVGRASAGGASTDTVRSGSTPPVTTPAEVPDTPTDFGDEPEVPSACTLSPPSPAPSVTPSREIEGAQGTVESAARQSLPADLASTTAPVSDDAVCQVPEAPVDAPSVPLPATPVGGATVGNPALQLLLALLFA